MAPGGMTGIIQLSTIVIIGGLRQYAAYPLQMVIMLMINCFNHYVKEWHDKKITVIEGITASLHLICKDENVDQCQGCNGSDLLIVASAFI